MKKVVFIVSVLFLILSACNSHESKNESIAPEKYSDYLQKGNEISNLAQGVLLSNVGTAIQKGGTEYAVEFCNLKASSIIDSLNLANRCTISRVSDKNRNPQNFLQNETDENIWAYYSAHSAEILTDTLIQEQGKLFYYKPIKTGMPTCLKCHGTVGEDIATGTYEKLQKLYPTDLATGYHLNDFRGLWKIQFLNIE